MLNFAEIYVHLSKNIEKSGMVSRCVFLKSTTILNYIKIVGKENCLLVTIRLSIAFQVCVKCQTINFIVWLI